MSTASPGSIIFRGRVHPCVLVAARAVSAPPHRWRITSIYRPGPGTHSQGISFDTAPEVFTVGGFGLKTALAVWTVVKQAVPHLNWLANAELDHIHVQIFPTDSLGMNEAAGTVLYPLSAGK